ncbi:MAG: c-type cytochrome [Candidatus Eiseniibacteriota bacterium]
MTVSAQKYLVAFLSLALFAALVAVGGVDAKRRAEAAKSRQIALAGALNPQLERGRAVFVKYSCNACHGQGGAGGIKNLNAQTGGEINGLTRVSETYTRQELMERIRNGVPNVDKSDPTGPDPPLRMPAYRDLIAGQELEDLTSYLFSLRPSAESKPSEAW